MALGAGAWWAHHHRLSTPTTAAPLKRSQIRVCPDDPLAVRPDGRVVRVPLATTVVIDRGVDVGVRPGATFEVYDQQTGIPANGPAGKATAEVIRVMPGYSECRVVRKTKGDTINIGDLIIARVPERQPR